MQTSSEALGSAASARLEDLRAQIVGMPDSQTSLDLWVPNDVTMNGAPIRQDLAMALLLEQVLSRGLFPRGFTEGTGGRLYHYRQGPPDAPGLPAAPAAPRLVPRDVQVGRAYNVRAERREGDGSASLTVDARVTVAAVGADNVVLDVLAAHGTRSAGSEPLFTDVRFKLTVPTRAGVMFPGSHEEEDDSPQGFEFLDPRLDANTRVSVGAAFNTIGFEACVLPHEPHKTGDKWTEPIPPWFTENASIAWEAGPVMIHAGGAFAHYDAVWQVPSAQDPSTTFKAYEVSLSVRTDDGFVGECDVKDFTLGPNFPTKIDHITSTRIDR